MTAEERSARTDSADALCRTAFVQALGAGTVHGMALVAVGGYGRRELAPYSDLDVVLVHDSDVEVREVAASLWYPVWDAGLRLDHSVRALPEVTQVAAADVRVALGLLDARHLAGDAGVTLRLRAEVLARWRREARNTLPRLRRLVEERIDRNGELAQSAVPDLKESGGGLRDATVLEALVATWLVEVPRADLERCRRQLLDVRDALHAVHGRASDRVTPEVWTELAQTLGVPDDAAAQRQLRQLGRRTAHLSRLTWRRVDHLLAAVPAGVRGGHDRVPRSFRLRTLAAGVAIADGEVVLDRSAAPDRDPLLLLRAATIAAERGVPLNPATAARLAQESAWIPEPWPPEARRLLVRLLAAGDGLLAVWETLDETGALERVLPEWDRIRLLPHASAIHRYTVDRHVVETCIAAARLIRKVSRPDLLLVAAVLHDIGKGDLFDHSVAGAPVAAAAAHRWGFDEADVSTIRTLVRHHLLLAETAVSRDPQDPATVAHVVAHVADLRTLDLLEALTEADSRATSAQAWTRWRAGLVAELVARTRHALNGHRVADRGRPSRRGRAVCVPDRLDQVELHVESQPDGARVTVTAPDRIGLMADVAGALSGLGVGVRAARAWTDDEEAVSQWEVDEPNLDPALLRQRVTWSASGTALRVPAVSDSRPRLPPVVTVHHEASEEATVLEVRTDDRPGVLHEVLRTLAELDLTVRSAHIVTLGPQVLDVLYVHEPAAGALSDIRAAAAAHAVRAALQGAATLDA